MAWSELYDRGGEQLGVVTPACAVSVGISRERLRRRAEHERWPQPAPGAYLLPGWRPDGRARIVARALASGRDVVVTGHSALALHGLLRTPPSTTDLLVADNRRTVALPGVRTRWTVRLPPGAVVRRHGVAATDVARSLASIAGTTTPRRLRALALDAVSQRQLTVPQLARELDARARFPGRAAVLQLRDDLLGDGSESGFEFDTRQRLADLGLAPDPEQATVVTSDGVRRIDLPYRHASVGVECQGFAYHSAPAELEADARRSNAIAALDRWLLLRLTLRMFHLDFEPFAAQLRACLERRGAVRA